MSGEIDLDAYFRRIGHDGPAAPDLATLRALHRLQPEAIAFENLDPLLGRPVSLDAAALERKLVLGRRGGYCFEQNELFRHALAALGFEVRVLVGQTLWQQPPDAVPARGHMALEVALDGAAYLADVGFGALTLTGPLRLGTEVPQPTPHGRFRLVAEAAGHRLEADLAGTWQALYRFEAAPASPLDVAFANQYLASHPASPFVRELMAARPVGEARYGLRGNRLSKHGPNGRSEHREIASALELRQTLEGVFGLAVPEGARLEALLARLATGEPRAAPDGIVLRPAAPADDAACGRIISAATLAAPTGARLPHARALFEDTSPLDPEGRARLVAADAAGGEVLGFADYDPALAHLRYLFIAPAAQGRGIGRALVDGVQARCGGRALDLTCFAVNDKALAWYLRQGFAVTGGGFTELAGEPVVHVRLALPPQR